MMSDDKTISELLGDFSATPAKDKQSLKGRGPVTIWLPPDAKERYDRLQMKSGKTFSKKVRELLLVMIEKAEVKTA